jgi:hypothetical protein
VPEGLTAEVAKELAGGGERSRVREEIVEILEAIGLALVAIATAWSGYQAARWDGHQAELFGLSSKYRFVATQAATLGGQQRLYDTQTFNFWLQTRSSGDKQAAAMFAKRFRGEYRPAFAAWLATRPFTNPNAPAGPIVMPQYHNAEQARATVYERRASSAFELGNHARENGDKYVRNTVLLATVLFLIAVAQRFKLRNVRFSLLGVGLVLLGVALYFVVSYPVA